MIKQIVGPEVRVIDPAPAVARQAARLLEMAGLREKENGTGLLRFYTSGEPARFSQLLPTLLGEPGEVQQSIWSGKEIHSAAGVDRFYRQVE